MVEAMGATPVKVFMGRDLLCVFEKEELVADQASKRGGILYCRRIENKVVLSGKAAIYSIAELLI